MNIKNFRFNSRTKQILTGIIISTLLITITNVYITNKIQSKFDKTYSAFAKSLSKIIAEQTTEIEENIKATKDKKEEILSEKYAPFFNKNIISYIEYKDKNNNIIYSSKNNYANIKETDISISSPVTKNKEISGSVTIGITQNDFIYDIKSIIKTISITLILVWCIFIILLILNFFFMSKELQKIYKGVKKISTGKFGYKLESDNIPELTDAFNNMSNILSQYEEQNIEQLTLERNKLEAVLMSIINGVVVCDNFDNVVLANSASLKMLDIEEEHFIGKKIQDYIDSHGQKCFLEKIEEFKDTPLNIIEQKPIEFNIEAGKLTIKSMISPMFSKQQDYVGYIIVLIDITRETEVNKLKNTFISNVSHELRTPVTVLRTYIDTLCNNGDDFDEETKKEFMHTIDTEAKRLHSMVNDILDFSRLESGNINLRKEYTNIVELIEQNINSIKILAEEKNIEISFYKEQEIPNIPINIESIDRVIRNLLSNAIKYSFDNTQIIVNTGLSDDKQYVKFSVKDNGIGIEKEHLEKIFERFYRVENATHTIKGTGLGLHLVKITVEKHHHGKITVTSKINEGSVFTVFLPITTDESELV